MSTCRSRDLSSFRGRAGGLQVSCDRGHMVGQGTGANILESRGRCLRRRSASLGECQAVAVPSGKTARVNQELATLLLRSSELGGWRWGGCGVSGNFGHVTTRRRGTCTNNKQGTGNGELQLGGGPGGAVRPVGSAGRASGGVQAVAPAGMRQEDAGRTSRAELTLPWPNVFVFGVVLIGRELGCWTW